MEPLRPEQRQQILDKDPNAGKDLEEYERLLSQRFTNLNPSSPEDEERINQLYEKLFGNTTQGVDDSTMEQDDIIPPAPTHRWCEIHQDALLASRGFYRLSATILLMLLCLQKWYESGVSFWIILPVWFLLWRAHQWAGTKIEDINYLHAEEKWDLLHGHSHEDDT